MDYPAAVRSAPPGWRHFAMGDIGRLPQAVLDHELARIPDEERREAARGSVRAQERMRRALFWTFVYHLEPHRWDHLAACEPVHPDLVAALPDRVRTAIDVGAGAGRLTAHLSARADHVVAVEPSLPLSRLLAERVPSAHVVAGWAESLPLPSHGAQLTAACGVIGPDPRVLSELYRVTAAGGCIALISPEHPEWFEAHGWSRVTVRAAAPAARPGWIDDFFGRPDPPRELVMLRVD